jgi:hypothetical protein
VSASPKRATAEPPSGTATPLAENENIAVPLLWVEKLHSMLVGSNPLPLTAYNSGSRYAKECCILSHDSRRKEIEGETTNTPQTWSGRRRIEYPGFAIVAWVPAGIPPKWPVLPGATLLKPALLNMSNQVVTCVAVAREFVSNWTAPAKLMFPSIAVA